MEQHPIPKNVTNFEFKLIGFMTLKQFLYLLAFVPVGVVVGLFFPIPIIKYLIGLVIICIGIAFAFVPIQDRPLDVWVANLYKRISKPTAYIYKKEGVPLDFLKDLYFTEDPHKVLAHIEARDKLANYLVMKKQQASSSFVQQQKRKQHVQTLIQHSTDELSQKTFQQTKDAYVVAAGQGSGGAIPVSTQTQFAQQLRNPFFTGIVKNNKRIPLPGILVYIKDGSGNNIRILKTNPHGVFATYYPLSEGQYVFELKDPNGSYYFEKSSVEVRASNPSPFQFFSRELL